MRGKAKKLLWEASERDEGKYKILKSSWKGLPWPEKTALRKYVESKKAE